MPQDSLGRTFALALLANGARVVALGRSERLQAEAKGWANEFGADKISVKQIDMYDTTALNDLCDAIAAEEKTIDVLINNAHELGASTGFNVPEGVTRAGELRALDEEPTGRRVLGGADDAAVGGADERGEARGSIVNIATMYATVAPRPQLYEGTSSLNPPGYSASKAALAAFTRYTASFWGTSGVRANCLSPGPFSNTEDVGG